MKRNGNEFSALALLALYKVYSFCFPLGHLVGNSANKDEATP